MNWKLAGMAGTALTVVALSSVSVAGGNKFTGSVSLGVGQTFQDDTFFPDDSFTSLSGEAKLNIAFESNLNLQFDLKGYGAFVDNGPERNAGFQFTTHGYARNGNYALGLFGGAGIVGGPDGDDAEYYFVGVQGQHYWRDFTFGLNAGYLDSSATDGASDEFLSDAWFGEAEVRWYATPKVTLTGNVGYIAGETFFGAQDQETWHWGVKAEYKPEEKEPLSLWIAYEGRDTNLDFNPGESGGDSHTVKVGLTIRFGADGDTQQSDREGPAFNQMDYGSIVVDGAL